ncbi:MAG: lambda-exonuclease family protein [Planctomycetota bacterium]
MAKRRAKAKQKPPPQPEPGLTEAQWHELRRTHIGASEAAAALGMSRWQSRLDLCRVKWGELVVETTEPMRRGILLEPLVAELYRRATGHDTEKGLWIESPEHPFMSTTLDLVDRTDDCLVQLKTASTWARDLWGAPGSPTAPADYILQVQHEMAVTGATEDRLAVLFADQSTFRGLCWMLRGGMAVGRVLEYVEEMVATEDSRCEFLLVPVKRDDAMIAAIIEGERQFWETYVLPHVEPPDDAIPQRSSDMLEADEQQRDLLRRLRDAKRAQKVTDERYEQIAAEVRTAIGEAAGIVADGICTISYKAPPPTADLDYEGLVVQARRRRIAEGATVDAAILEHTTAATDWQAVWSRIDPRVGAVRDELVAQATRLVQGRRRFAPRFERD